MSEEQYQKFIKEMMNELGANEESEQEEQQFSAPLPVEIMRGYSGIIYAHVLN